MYKGYQAESNAINTTLSEQAMGKNSVYAQKS